MRGLRAAGHHGALPGEQDQSQPFEIDLDVHANLSVAGATDDLADTIDYGAAVRAADRVVSRERWKLLERIAERIAEDVFSLDRRVEMVMVAVRKLAPPVEEPVGTAGVRIFRHRLRAFLGLGSNLGDREAALRTAVEGLPDVVAVSPVYETSPVGGPPDQPPYLNVVVELSTGRTPRGLLIIGQRLEAAAGRDRATEERNGPRPLDVDVLLAEPLHVDEPDLTVPHPRMWERRFVLAPLADLAPGMVGAEHLERAAGEVRCVGRL